MNFNHRFAGMLIALVLLSVSAHAASVGDTLVVTEEAGVIQSLDLGQSTLVIDGLRYRLAPDVQVSIAGSYGAPSMLSQSMRVRFRYWRETASDRVIVALEQLPGSVRMDEY
jgi:hypothetical protein